MIDFIGWTGALLLAVCALPQTIKCYRQGHAHGVDSLFLWLWTTGEVLMLVYSVEKLNDTALIVNYLFNLVCLVIILRYRYFPRR